MKMEIFYLETGKIKLKMKSKGLGDSIEKITKATGIKYAVDKAMKGKDCGCGKRKDKLNKMFPYDK